MHNSQGHTVIGISRRRLFAHGALAVAGVALAGVALTPEAAAAKVTQKGVAYQPTPKGAARCDKCTFWQGPASCKLVSGTISPNGWCSLYGPK
ncbi:MAG: high-potential iron-sulfur protein [Caulobacteraceae bacterium]